MHEKKTNGVASVVTSHEEREHSQFRSQLTYHAPRPMIISIFPLLIGVHSFDHTQPKKLLFGVTMTTLRQFCLDDCLRFNNINLDVLTETYNGKSNRTWEAIDGPPFHVSPPPSLSLPYAHTHTQTGAFYMSYLAKWPESFIVAESPSQQLMGYVLGKAEGEDKLWHGHVSAVTVAPR